MRCQPDRRIDRSFGSNVPADVPVFGVPPRTLVLSKSFTTGDELIKMRFAVYQKIAMLFVVYERVSVRVVKGSIADLVLVDAQVVMKKYPDLARRSCIISQTDPPNKDIVMTGNSIAASHCYS